LYPALSARVDKIGDGSRAALGGMVRRTVFSVPSCVLLDDPQLTTKGMVGFVTSNFDWNVVGNNPP